MEVLPQALVNAKVRNDCKETFMEDAEVASKMKALDDKYAGAGRVLIRPSGTEPLVRVMIEGKNQEEITKDAKELASMIEEKFGR
jgi:phosphoglucosamine mutase